MKRQIVTLAEVEKIQTAQVKKCGKAYSPEELMMLKVRTKHPVKRTLIFLMGSAFLTISGFQFWNGSFWIGLLFFLPSTFLYYMSIYGDRHELNQCLLESGDLFLQMTTDLISNVP